MKELPIVVVACRVVEDLLAPHLPEGLAREVIYTDYGLHRHPARLNETLQETLEAIAQPSLVVLGYGLCGDGLNGLQAGRHWLLMPRTDDCVALLLGSRQAYRREFEAAPGTYYLTKGWLESDDHPLKEYEEYVQRYGAQDAAWIMDMQYQHYERLAFVAHNQADLDRYRPQAQRVAGYCRRWGMRYQEMLGSDAYVRRLVAAAWTPDEAGSDFVVVPPGGEVHQAQFLE